MTEPSSPPVLELRVALTARDYESLVGFYCDGLGLETTQVWPAEQGRAVILDMGQATLEVFDEKQADTIDRLEAGRRISGQVRFALQVPDLQAAMQRLLAHGATLVHPPSRPPGEISTSACKTRRDCRSRCFKLGGILKLRTD